MAPRRNDGASRPTGTYFGANSRDGGEESFQDEARENDDEDDDEDDEDDGGMTGEENK